MPVNFALVGIVLTSLAYLMGIVSTFSAIMNARTSQGAIAWSISLCTFPL